MMTSSNGNISRVTGHLCGEFTGQQWIRRTKASDAELWCFLWSVQLSKQFCGEAGDLRRNRAYYDVTVMLKLFPTRLYWARFLSLARSKLSLCSANHRPGYWSNLPCGWPSTAWVYSEQETLVCDRESHCSWVWGPWRTSLHSTMYGFTNISKLISPHL